MPESDRSSEAWRHECEIRYVLRMPSREHRAGYLALVTEKRGRTEGERLRAAVMAAWGKRQETGDAETT